MNKEDKDLLLLDLCSRLPYGVKGIEANSICLLDTSAYFKSLIKNIEYKIGHLGFKPYLFPLSSMTEEQKMFLKQQNWCIAISTSGTIETTIEGINWLNKNHFDYRGLIEKGLAIDCTNLNIY